MKNKRLITPLCLFACLTQFLPALTLEIQPSFESASIYLQDADSLDYQVKYRAVGSDTWLESPELVWTDDLPIPRNSLLGLMEGHSYQVSVWQEGGQVAEKTFTTMSSDLPIGETITLTGGAVTIRKSGTPDAWIRYVADDVIDAADLSENAITLEGVEYVILDGLEIKGGKINAISILNSKHIRVRNCDISGWGRAGVRRYDKMGKFYDSQGKLINRDTGVLIEKSHSVVVEYCYIHDPRGTANSWVFSHPAGPSAIYVIENENTIIRYNDFIGSDAHRWNDVIESAQNGSPEGGFRKDADIYGNTMIYGSDDAMELDGGQMNMRVWGNLIVGTFAGISTAPTFHGPSYLYNNLLLEQGDRWGLYGDALKNNHRAVGDGAVYFVNNTAVNTGMVSGFSPKRSSSAPYVVQNNVLEPKGGIVGLSATNSDLVLDHNLFWAWDTDYRQTYQAWCRRLGLETNGVEGKPIFVDPAKGDYVLAESSPGYDIAAPIPGFPDYGTRPGISGSMPQRPNGLKVSQGLVTLDGESPVELQLTLQGVESMDFKLLKNNAFSWFLVNANKATLIPGSPVTLSVELLGAKPKLIQHGAFIVKLSNGLSIPVLVRTTGDKPERIIEATDPGVVALIEAETMSGVESYTVIEEQDASSGKAVVFLSNDLESDTPGDIITTSFHVPEDGVYYMAVRFFAEVPAGSHNSIFLGLNDDPLVETQFRGEPGWNWSGISRVQELRNKPWFEPIRLKAGDVTIRLAGREPLLLDSILVMKTPEVIFSSDS